jgi:hypothetical protein
VPGEEGEWGAQCEYTEEDGVTPVEENEDGKETGESETAYDARRPGFWFPARGIVLRVNADALVTGYYTRARKDLPTNTAIWTCFYVLFTYKMANVIVLEYSN